MKPVFAYGFACYFVKAPLIDSFHDECAFRHSRFSVGKHLFFKQVLYLLKTGKSDQPISSSCLIQKILQLRREAQAKVKTNSLYAH